MPRPQINGSLKDEIFHARTLVDSAKLIIALVVAAIAAINWFNGKLDAAEERVEARYVRQAELQAEAEMRERCFGEVERRLDVIDDQQSVLDDKMDRVMVRLGVEP